MFSRLTVARAMAFGIGLAVIYYFVMFDNGVNQTNRIAQAKAQTAEFANKIKEDQAKLDRALLYKKSAAETGTTITKLLALIPERFDTPDLMKIISNETKVAGTSLLNIIPGQTAVSSVSPEFEEISVTVDMNGSFLQHMVFLSNLTKVPQILVIRKFDMASTSEQKSEEAAVVHMTAEIVAYRYRGTPTPDPTKAGAK